MVKPTVHQCFWLITLAIFSALLIPALVQDGMFLDGITYASISRNLAEGRGSVWKPHYTQTLYASFYEHPPLSFIFQSLFFRLFGDSIYVERLYSFLTAVFSLWGIVLLWKLFTKETEYEKFSWFPVLLWILVPTVFWSYRNNMLENTLTVFTTFSIYFLIRYLQNGKKVHLIGGSAFILLAFLTKGFVGLFPLAVAGIHFITHRKTRLFKTIINTLIILILLVFFTLLSAVLFPDLMSNIAHYLQTQLLPSINNKREVTTGNRLYIFLLLLQELCIPATVVFLLWLWKRKEVFKNPFTPKAALFLLIGISASLPLAVTLKQRGYYLVPSIPFYVLCAGFFGLPYLSKALEKTSTNFLKYIAYTTIAASIIITGISFGKYSRDEALLKDLYTIKNEIKKGEVFGTETLCYEWKTVAYLCRVNYYSLDCGKQHRYFITRKEETIPEWVTEEYTQSVLPLSFFQLYQKKE